MREFEINFFELDGTLIDNEYTERCLGYTLSLPSIGDIQNFFDSDFYAAAHDFMGGISDGIVITEQGRVIYKIIEEGFFDNKFLIYTGKDGKIYYQELKEGEVESSDFIIADEYNMDGYGFIKNKAISR